MWNTSGSKKAKKLGGAAVASLQVDDPVVALAACSAPGVGDGGDSFYAAAVTEAGEAFVWLCAPEGEAALVATPVARVRVGGSKPAVGGGAGADAVLSVGLEAADSGERAGCGGRTTDLRSANRGLQASGHGTCMPAPCVLWRPQVCAALFSLSGADHTPEDVYRRNSTRRLCTLWRPPLPTGFHRLPTDRAPLAAALLPPGARCRLPRS